ncbi:hypothetical protein RNJ44_04515 [Nakaseomyces bracarensis]|uniref:Uncharacterized protein n=1 Tax=Nakaseomyces bracarensis TaxID=273131 RepID=A0ABR4NV47_9SACH
MSDTNKKEEEPLKIRLNRGGRIEEYDPERFRKPHNVTPRRFPNNPLEEKGNDKKDNAGGLLQNQGHRPTNN